jgi:hypothetical protein
MRLIVFTVVAGTMAGLLAGGSLRGFPSVRLRGAWLAVTGVVLQFVPLTTGGLGIASLYASFACLVAFAILNVHTHGFALILIGLALNAVVIVANEGMPVTRRALEGSHQSATLGALIADGGAKHHLADGGTILLPLADVIPLGDPLDLAISVGDVIVQLGAAWFIVSAMPRRQPRIVGGEAAP